LENQSSLRGHLEDLHFPQLLFEISQRKDTGVLYVSHREIVKSIYFQDGRIVFAKSNDPDDALGELFLRRGKITWKQQEDAAARLVPGKRLGTILVEDGVIQAADLYQGVIDQIKEILFSLFEWVEGEYHLDRGDLPAQEVITLNISTPDVIIGGIGRISRWSWIRNAVGKLSTIYIRKEGWSLTYRKMSVSPDVQGLLDRMDGPRTVEQILSQSPFNNFETCRWIWIFYILGIFEREGDEEIDEVNTELEEYVPPGASASAENTTQDRTGPMESAADVTPRASEIEAALPEAANPAPAVREMESLSAPAATTEASVAEQADLNPFDNLDLSFSDFAEFTDAPEAPPEPAQAPASQPDATKDIPTELKRFNEKHRYLFEMLQIEIGSSVTNFVSKILKRVSEKFPLVFEGVQMNEFGELDETTLSGNIEGNLVENYTAAFEYLLDEEVSTIQSVLDSKRAAIIVSGLSRIRQAEN